MSAGLEYPLSYKQPNTCLWNILVGEVEEIEQHNKELCKENRELKDSQSASQKQTLDMQASSKKKQVCVLVKCEWGDGFLSSTHFFV